MSIVSKIPKSETGYGVHYTTSSGNIYIISNNPIKRKFTLWKELEEGYEKLGPSSSPVDLYKKCK